MAEVFVGGCFRLAVFGRDATTGAAIGSSTTKPADDTTTHAYSFRTQNSASLLTDDINRVEFQGSDKVLGKMAFGTTAVNGATITLSSINDAFVAFLGGTAVDATSNSEHPQFAPFVDSNQATNIGAILSAREQDTTTGVETYIHYVLPNCTGQLSIGDLGYQAAQAFTLELTANESAYDIGGGAFSGQSMSVPDDKLTMYAFHTTYPIAVTTYIQDNSTTTFTAAYKPVDSTVTVNATPNNLWIGGTRTALSSFSTSTAVATLSVAGTASVIDVLLYETNYVTP